MASALAYLRRDAVRALFLLDERDALSEGCEPVPSGSLAVPVPRELLASLLAEEQEPYEEEEEEEG